MARAVCGTDSRSRTCKQQPVIIHTILIDMGDIGAQLRWFSVFLGGFKNAVDLPSPEELAMLGNDRKWIKELRLLIRAFKARGLIEEAFEEILTSFCPGTTILSHSSSEEDEGPDVSDNFFDEDSDGALTGGGFLEHVRLEHFDVSEVESFEENSEIG